MAAPDRYGSRNGADRRDRGGGNGRTPAGGAGGRTGGRSSGPVVPAKREQRIERSPNTVVRQAGEVRGRARTTPPAPDRDVSWSHSVDDRLDDGVDDRPTTGFEIVGHERAADPVPDTTTVVRTPSSLPVPMGHPLPAPLHRRVESLDDPTDVVFDADVVFDTARVPLIELPAAPADPDTGAVPSVPATATVALTEAPVVVAPAAVADAVVATEPAAEPAPAPGRRTSLFKRRSRVRKVSRVVRRIDAWSVLKVSLIFYALTGLVVLIAGVLLWNLAQSTGTVDNVEGFVRELFSLKTFKIDGARVYRASWPIVVFLVVAGTGLNVTAAVMFNLITDLVGGVRVTVLEEEVRVVESASSRRRRLRAAAPAADAADARATPATAAAGAGNGVAAAGESQAD